MDIIDKYTFKLNVLMNDVQAIQVYYTKHDRQDIINT